VRLAISQDLVESLEDVQEEVEDVQVNRDHGGDLEKRANEAQNTPPNSHCLNKRAPNKLPLSGSSPPPLHRWTQYGAWKAEGETYRGIGGPADKV